MQKVTTKLISDLKKNKKKYLDQNPSLSFYTIRNQNIDIENFINFLAMNLNEKFDLDLSRKFISEKNKSTSLKSVQRVISHMKSFFTYLKKREISEKNYFESIPKPKNNKSLPKIASSEEINELIDLEDVLPRARNYNVSVSENKGEIVFLRHIVRGGSDRSYGIHVARLAGLPNPVINRAWEILSTLEEQIHTSGYKNHDKSSLNVQLSLMDTDQSLLNDILSLDVDALTPLQSIIKLFEIQETARKKR